MTLEERLQLRARMTRARTGWLRIEDAAANHDQELDERIACARLAMLDAIDRLDQLLGNYDLELDARPA